MRPRKGIRQRQRRALPIVLSIDYSGGHSRLTDEMIERVVGRSRDGSGFCFLDGRRDLSFSFATRATADRAAKRAKEVFGRRIRCKVSS